MNADMLTPFKLAVPFILAAALGAVVGRIYLKYRHRRRLDVDDYILIFGTICYIAATGLYYSMMDTLYITLLVGTQPQLLVLLYPAEQMALFTRQLEMHASFHALTSTAIFTVKFGFFYFFGKVVQPRPALYLYWKIAIVITVIFSLYFVCIPFIACPMFGPKAVMQCQGPAVRWRVDFLAYLGFATDCFTDLLSTCARHLRQISFALTNPSVISIPILVLQRAKVELRQKMTVAVFLCLSSVMIMVAIVRVTTMHTPAGVWDYTWTNLWLYVEAGTAIVMVSLTAFRTQFTLRKEERQRQERMKQPPTYRGYVKSRSWLRRRTDEEEETTGLPAIPGATMTGLMSFMKGDKTRVTTLDTTLHGEPLEEEPKTSVEEESVASSVTTGPRSSEPWITSPSWLANSHPTSAKTSS